MTTTVKDVAAKFAVAAVAVAMVFSAYAPAAQAQTTEDLQQMINDLLAQVAQLQAQTGQGANSVASGVCPYTWTRDLTMGSTGDDVMKLQQFLNANADTRVAAEGAGSVGAETMYYGPATAAAVSKMQVMYRADVLTPNGLMNPTGYFGPSTRAKANALCAVATEVEEEDEDEMEEEEDEDEDITLGGEASLDSFEIDDADDIEVQEGDEEVAIGEFTVEFTNGDAEISRLDIGLEKSGSDAWDVFETIQLWVDGDMIAEVDASDEDDYLDEDDGELRFTNLALVAMEDEELVITVGATIQDNLDNTDIGLWDLRVSSMRFFDADGVATTENSAFDIEDDFTGPAATFEIEEAGEGEELNFSLAGSNPDATDIVVDETSTTNDVTVLAYTIEAEEGDIELNTLFVKLTTSAGERITDVVSDIELVIDGQTFRDESVLAAGDVLTTTATYEFDIDGDITIDEDDEVEVEVVVDFKRQSGTAPAGYLNGTTIKAEVGSTERDLTDAEGADDVTDFSGTAIGDVHTLVAEGIVVAGDSFDDSFATQGQDNTIGIFTIDFEVTAVEGDFYIADLATLGTAATSGVEFTVDGPATASSATAVLSSTGDENTAGDAFVIREGETETITLTVTVDASASGQHRIVLGDINYTADEDGVTATTAYTPLPVTDFRTAFGNINQI